MPRHDAHSSFSFFLFSLFFSIIKKKRKRFYYLTTKPLRLPLACVNLSLKSRAISFSLLLLLLLLRSPPTSKSSASGTLSPFSPLSAPLHSGIAASSSSSTTGSHSVIPGLHLQLVRFGDFVFFECRACRPCGVICSFGVSSPPDYKSSASPATD